MRCWLFFILLLIFSNTLLAQINDELKDNYDDSIIERQTISENDLEEYANDRDFDYTDKKVEESSFSRFKRWLSNILRQFWEAIFGSGTAEGFIWFVFRVLPYIVLGLLIFLLVRFFLKVNSNALVGKDKAQSTVNFSEEEQIIKNEDINSLISEAIKNKNYRLAIRYYYLLSLKLLSEASLITWQPQKTNADYINELTNSELKPDFQNITKIYDYVWYGEFDINELKYESLKLPFQSLNSNIK